MARVVRQARQVLLVWQELREPSAQQVMSVWALQVARAEPLVWQELPVLVVSAVLVAQAVPVAPVALQALPDSRELRERVA